MEDTALFQLRQAAGNARKAGQLAEALGLYQQLWEEHISDCNAWDGWGYAWCLYKHKRYDEALAIVEQARDLDAGHPALRSLHAWCLYQTGIKPEKVRPEQFEAALKQILNLSSQVDSYSPMIPSIFKAMEVYKGQPETQLHYLGYLDPELLSRTGERITDARGKSRELPSDWLRYQAKWSEALYQLGEYAACAAECEDVLADAGMAPGQRLWFQRRLARALQAQGQLTEAVALYRQILTRKQDWFLKKELAELLLALNQTDEALQLALAAALDRGDDAKKLNLYLLLANLLAHSEPALAVAHKQYVLRLRQAHDWSISESLQSLLTADLPESSSLRSQLKTGWQRLLAPPGAAEQVEVGTAPATERLRGQILNFLPHGQAGFLRPDDPAKAGSKSLYFELRSFDGPPETLKTGVHVSFAVREGFDHKKQRKALQAINLQRVQTRSTDGPPEGSDSERG